MWSRIYGCVYTEIDKKKTNDNNNASKARPSILTDRSKM